MSACVNHQECQASAACARCRNPFCGGCLTFSVNGDPWCEPCGNGLLDTGKGNRPLALLVLVVGLAITLAIVLAPMIFLGRYFIYSALLVAVPIGAAWRIAYPPTTGDAPVIVRRAGTR